MRIQDLENRTGLERPTIRFYEREGLICPKRSENGYREYSEQDVDQLMKIKLLRQLGMSVEKIKKLQQGSADFSKTLAQQLQTLTSQIEEHKRARAVCQVMQSDGVDYSTMDAAHYLKLMREISVDGRTAGYSDFQEKLPKEIHPWQRYIARGLDYMLFVGLIEFVLFVVIRIRPIPGAFVNTLIGIFGTLLFVPVEALMLHKWGTTPGKWAMGLRLEYIQGGNLPWQEALYRSWRVFVAGTGCGIPYVEIICNSYCYCKLTGRSWRQFARYDEVDPPEDMDWDEETEIIYGEPAIKWLAVVIAVWAVISGITVTDMIKPKYRGSDLTIAQFAENYNSTVRLLNENYEQYDTLQSDGTKYPVPNNTFVLTIGGEAKNEREDFAYDLENGFLRTVSYENSWTDVFFLMPLEGDCYTAAVSILLAQDGCGIREMQEFANLWEQYQDETHAKFTYKNLEISWDMELDNTRFLQGTATRIEDDQESKLDFSFRILLNES